VGENFKFLRYIFYFCEFIGNGLVWFGLTIWSIWTSQYERYTVVLYNFLYGLLLDIIMVGLVKQIVRRERQKKNSLDISVDKYSFPSGHASRATFIALFMINNFRLRQGFFKDYIIITYYL